MKILLSNFDLGLLISGGCAIIVGVIIFFSIGIYKVKKKHAVIIEKVDTFYKVIEQGWHYYLPIIYRRVGYYCIAPQQRTVYLDNGKKLLVSYQIVDVKTYHYSGIKIEDLLKKIRRDNESITKDLLISEFEKRGLLFLSIQ